MKSKILLAIQFILFFVNVNSQPYFIKHYGNSSYQRSYSMDVSANQIMQAGCRSQNALFGDDVFIINTNMYGNLMNSYYIDLHGMECAFEINYNPFSDHYVSTGYTVTYDSLDPRDSICGRDVFLLETNRNGVPIWAKRFGIDPVEDVGRSVIVTSDRYYVIAGYTSYICDSDSLSCSPHNVLLFKTDLSGNIIWSKSIDIESRDDYGMKVIEADNKYYVTGYSDDLHGNPEPFLMCVNTSGNVLWVRFYGDPNYEDKAFSLVEGDHGINPVVGHTYGFNSSGPDVFVFHTDYNGQPLWIATYPTYNNSQSSFGRDINKYKDFYYITGFSDEISNAPNFDINYIETDLSGNMLSESNFGGSGDERGFAIEHSGSDALISGYSYTWAFGQNDAVLLRSNQPGQIDSCYYFDPVGNPFHDTLYYECHFSSCNYYYEVDLHPGYIDAGGEKIVCGNDTDTIRARKSKPSEISFAESNFLINKNELTIKVNSEYNQNATIEIYNLVGDRIIKDYITFNTGQNVLSLNLPVFIPGIYLIRMSTNNLNVCKKILILNSN